MFPWPTLALGTHFRFRGNGLLGYSQTLTDHHFVMAARFCETLKSGTRTVQVLLTCLNGTELPTLPVMELLI